MIKAERQKQIKLIHTYLIKWHWTLNLWTVHKDTKRQTDSIFKLFHTIDSNDDGYDCDWYVMGMCVIGIICMVSRTKPLAPVFIKLVHLATLLIVKIF